MLMKFLKKVSMQVSKGITEDILNETAAEISKSTTEEFTKILSENFIEIAKFYKFCLHDFFKRDSRKILQIICWQGSKRHWSTNSQIIYPKYAEKNAEGTAEKLSKEISE